MRIKSKKYLDYTEDVYDLSVDTEEHNFTLGNGVVVHNCISDFRFAGISFKDQKDKVKIVAACNMGSSEMGENIRDGNVGSYNNAGAIDPALAARFAVYWKKNYDEKDVASFLDYLEGEKADGEIDGTVLDFVKGLPTPQALEFIASVEKRTLAEAEASTRALNQLSKDIKSMRGKKGSKYYQSALYKGRVIFTGTVKKEYEELNRLSSNQIISLEDKCDKAIDFVNKVTSQANTWEPALNGDKITIDTIEMSAQDVIDRMNELVAEIKQMRLRPLTNDDKDELEFDIELLLGLLDACSKLDLKVTEDRENIFRSYVGDKFTKSFIEYFNEVFGSDDDVEITIEMLEDETLIESFINRFNARTLASLGPEQKVDKCLELIREFWEVHNSRLPSKNYAMLLLGIMKVLPVQENMQNLLAHSGTTEDKVFAKAEGVGDGFILEILKNYPASFTDRDVLNMRKSMAQNSNTSKRKSRIL